MTDRGAVNAQLEAVVPLRVRGPTGDEFELGAVVDTGYTGSLALPSEVISSLGLTRRSGGRAVLADGSVRRFDTYTADVFWDGAWVGVVASVFGDETLIGMSLLAGRGLWVEVVPDGVVEVVPLGTRPGVTGTATEGGA